MILREHVFVPIGTTQCVSKLLQLYEVEVECSNHQSHYLRSNLRLEGSAVDRRNTDQPNNPSGSVEVQQIYLIVFATATTLPEYLLLVFTFDHIY